MEPERGDDGTGSLASLNLHLHFHTLVLEATSAKYPDITFGKVDTDAEQAIAGAFQILASPTLMAFRDGIIVYAESGALPASAFGKLIGAVKALDMDHVRAEVEKQTAAPA